MAKVFAIIFFGMLFLLFLNGAVRLWFSPERPKETMAILRFALIPIFFIPFFVYFLAGLVNIRFGWERNFFYLLPVYLLIIFYSLKTITGSDRHYYIISVVILALLLWTGIAGSLSWEKVNAERELIRCAAGLDSEMVIAYGRGAARWPFIYYSKKYGVCDKVLFLHRGAVEKECLSEYGYEDKVSFLDKRRTGGRPFEKSFPEISERLSNLATFLILEVIENHKLLEEGRYRVGENLFEIVKISRHKAKMGPYQFLKDLLKLPSPYVAIYYCRR